MLVKMGILSRIDWLGRNCRAFRQRSAVCRSMKYTRRALDMRIGVAGEGLGGRVRWRSSGCAGCVIGSSGSLWRAQLPLQAAAVLITRVPLAAAAMQAVHPCKPDQWLRDPSRWSAPFHHPAQFRRNPLRRRWLRAASIRFRRGRFFPHASRSTWEESTGGRQCSFSPRRHLSDSICVSRR
jgi:hypothetical protein